MKIGVMISGVAALAFSAGLASAQQVPRSRLGFQMDVRTGYSVAMGNVGDDAKMSDVASGQIPFIVDIGGKVMPELFLGGYFGLGIGGASGVVKEGCDRTNQQCIGVTAHLGVEAQVHFMPSRLANPWIGYGIGIESLAVSQSNANGNGTDSLGYTGFELARFMGGVDFRVNRVFGVGPFVDLTIAQFNTVSANSQSADIENAQTHEWLTFGARFVFFP